MLTESFVDCPYCGEGFSTEVDCSAGSFQFVEDCPVCCRPIEFDATIDLDGNLNTLAARRDDE